MLNDYEKMMVFFSFDIKNRILLYSKSYFLAGMWRGYAIPSYFQLLALNNQQVTLHIMPEDCLNLGHHSLLKL